MKDVKSVSFVPHLLIIIFVNSTLVFLLAKLSRTPLLVYVKNDITASLTYFFSTMLVFLVVLFHSFATFIEMNFFHKLQGSKLALTRDKLSQQEGQAK